MKILHNQQGFAPLIAILILAMGVTSVGTVTASNNSTPGDALFGLDKSIEEIKVSFTPGEKDRAKIRLEIAEERLEELQALASTNKLIDPAIPEVHQALTNATGAVNAVEVKFKENKIKLQSSDLQALLTELQTLLTTHQGLIRKVEIKIEDGQVKAKIKLFEAETEETADLIEDDLDDLEDDGKLNSSTAQVLEVEIKGIIVKAGDVFQVTSGGITYTLTPGTGVNLENFVGKNVELEGFADNHTPVNVTVKKVEIEDDIEDDEEELEVGVLPEVDVKGFVRSSGGGFILTFNGDTPLYTLVSNEIDLGPFVNKFVKAEGTISGNILTVDEVEVRKTDSSGKPVAPALQQSTHAQEQSKTHEEEDKSDSSDDSDSGNSRSDSGRDDTNSDSDDEGED